MNTTNVIDYDSIENQACEIRRKSTEAICALLSTCDEKNLSTQVVMDMILSKIKQALKDEEDLLNDQAGVIYSLRQYLENLGSIDCCDKDSNGKTIQENCVGVLLNIRESSELIDGEMGAEMRQITNDILKELHASGLRENE